MQENTYNSLGKTLMNKLRQRNGGEFPTTATKADVVWALGECNKDTSDYMVRLGAAGLERAGVRVQGVSMESVEPDPTVQSRIDFLISSAQRGVSVQEALKYVREGEKKTKARQTAEKMARKAGKSETDDDWEKTVEKFEKNQKESTGGGSQRPFNEDVQDDVDELSSLLTRAQSMANKLETVVDRISLGIVNNISKCLREAQGDIGELRANLFID